MARQKWAQIPENSDFWAVEWQLAKYPKWRLESDSCFAEEEPAQAELSYVKSIGHTELEFRLSKFHKGETWPPQLIEVIAS